MANYKTFGFIGVDLQSTSEIPVALVQGDPEWLADMAATWSDNKFPVFYDKADVKEKRAYQYAKFKGYNIIWTETISSNDGFLDIIDILKDV